MSQQYVLQPNRLPSNDSTYTLMSPLRHLTLLLTVALWVLPIAAQTPEPIDADANKRTRALLVNLHRMVAEGTVLIGQQDPTPYGVGWRPSPTDDAASVEARADIYRVTGQLPSVHGWNVSKIDKRPFGIDTVDFDLQRDLIVRAYKRGGINTIAWHTDHPVTGGDSWDTTPVVADILPGGPHHDTYVDRLDAVADYLSSLKAGIRPFRRTVPIIFRPFHEHNGNWFWWGKAHCTPEEYVALWRFTVEYLRDVRGLHHLLYAYSPDIFDTREEYLERYPGDDYVDILGFDDYYDFYGPGRSPAMFTEQMRIVVELAEERGKVAALTETGREAIPDADWFTNVFWPALEADPVARRIAYIVFWRNARLDHHYVPYPEHQSAEDFRQLIKRDDTLMEDDTPDMYKTKR